MSILSKRVSENIKYYRTVLKLSQERLAEASGLSAGMIGKIEAEITSPSLRTVEKIAKALHVDPSMLTKDPKVRPSYKTSQIDSMVSDFNLFLHQKYKE